MRVVLCKRPFAMNLLTFFSNLTNKILLEMMYFPITGAVSAITVLPLCPWEERLDKRACRKQLAGYPPCLCGQSKNTTVPFSDTEAGWWHKIGRLEFFNFACWFSLSCFYYPNQAPVGLYSSMGLLCKYYESVRRVVCLSFLCNSQTQTEVNLEEYSAWSFQTQS